MKHYLLILPLLLMLGCGDERLPMTSSAGGKQAALPVDAVLLNAAEAAATGAFTVAGAVASFAEGDASAEAEPPTLTWQLERETQFQGSIWARVRWADACGNSLELEIPDFPPRVMGEDSVYGDWHWVQAANVILPAGQVPLVIRGREDGIAIDQLLLVPDSDFVPRGKIEQGGELSPTPRRFGDDFNRSPGHGLDNWRSASGTWDIAFSFDPNRIPNQFSLTGEATDGPARLFLETATWSGLRLVCSVRPASDAAFDILLEDGKRAIPLPTTTDRWRPGQWHAVVLERWGNLVRLWLDGELVHVANPDPGTGAIGFQLASDSVAIDDVQVEEIFWAELSDLAYRAEGDWFRDRDSQQVIGESGSLLIESDRFPIYAVSLAGYEANAEPGLTEKRRANSEIQETETGLLIDSGDWSEPRISLRAPGGDQPLRFSTLYARLTGPPSPARVELGPYHFSQAQLFDPSDYHDFTDEELATINSDDNKGLLERKPRLFPVVGKRSTRAAWVIKGGSWKVNDGHLAAAGQPAAVVYSQPLGLTLQFSGRLRAAGELRSASLSRASIDQPLVTAEQLAAAPADGWLPFRVTLPAAAVDEAQDELVRLKIEGKAEFDDLTFHLPKGIDGEYLYVFKERETDWWREGGDWIDHAGIACVITSSWISLVAPESNGRLVHKVEVGNDLSLAFTVEEHSQWYGWDKKHSHAHLPFDNIHAYLLDAAGEEVYRLEVNAEDRQETRLLRRGEPVATVRQDKNFPIRYRGGHSPYAPRVNRIYFRKQGDMLLAVINGREVLEFRDPQPLSVSRAGFGGQETHVNFSHIEVRDLSAKTDLTANR